MEIVNIEILFKALTRFFDRARSMPIKKDTFQSPVKVELFFSAKFEIS